ncbi:MAG TPA: ABC transporter ATP-binding protein [Dehalococcoidia bacterium]|nr:ABC transporter ATP-binding protein [Dehalococcoidia bacterium]
MTRESIERVVGAVVAPSGPAETRPTAISVRGLTKRYGAVTALNGLDLEVPAGAVFGFLGPNGAGKTTALSILAGLSHPDGGEARICGHDVVADGMAVRRRIGFLRQDPRFYTWMTGREVLQFTGRFFDLTAAELDRQADELLALVDLSGAASRTMGTYSGGMRQRLGIAQALMGQPEVLLLDEPCSSLDPAGRLEVIQIMERLRGTITVFYSTHILQDVERVADAVAITARGRTVMQGTLRELLAGSRTTLLVEVEGDPVDLIAVLRRERSIQSVEWEQTGDTALQRLRLEVRDLAAARRAVPPIVVRSGLLFVGCRPEQRSLEEVFLDLTDGDSGDITRK